METLTIIPEKTIVLDENLKPEELRTLFASKEIFLSRFNANMAKNEELILNAVKTKYYHRNYLEYLKLAWSYHYGIVVSPDILWHIMLSEIAECVKTRPDDFRSLFTNTQEGKQQIVIVNDSITDINLGTLILALKDHVPTNIDIFIPKFSTSTDISQSAFFAAFADMASPYYDYMMTLCAIPKVKILGDISEYERMVILVEKLNLLFNDQQINNYLQRIKGNFEKIVESIKTDNRQFWSDIFKIAYCGSGHPDKIEGWITEMFLDPSSRSINDMPSIVSMVEYKQIDLNRNFKKFVGLFGSNIEDEFLVPEFGYFVNEVK